MEKRSSDEKKKPSAYTEDPLTEVLRKGACALLAHAVGTESTSFLGAHAKIRDAQGHQMMVRNGYLPERIIQTGMRGIPVRGRRGRDQRAVPKADRIRFTSKILPRDLRWSQSLEELIPWLSLKGLLNYSFAYTATRLR